MLLAHVTDVPSYAMQALDTFNAAIVSPVYYVMFTTLTIIASAIMFKVSCLIFLGLLLNLSNIFIIFYSVTNMGVLMFTCTCCRTGLVRM